MSPYDPQNDARLARERARNDAMFRQQTSDRINAQRQADYTAAQARASQRNQEAISAGFRKNAEYVDKLIADGNRRGAGIADGGRSGGLLGDRVKSGGDIWQFIAVLIGLIIALKVWQVAVSDPQATGAVPYFAAGISGFVTYVVFNSRAVRGLFVLAIKIAFLAALVFGAFYLLKHH